MEALRERLRRVDGSAPAIQGAAAAMMKHYDRSAAVAVTEWRNALQGADSEQMLPLLYVANEVLQTSKRNRGNKFLEAYSPVLGQSLVHMAKSLRPASMTEKIRRTVKIWGDRRVFSIRFVNDLLAGLEPYRPGNRLAVPDAYQDETTGATFSPTSAAGGGGGGHTTSSNRNRKTKTTASSKQQQQQGSPTITSAKDDYQEGSNASTASHDDIMEMLEGHNHRIDDDDDDDDIFAEGSESQRLEIEINVDAVKRDASPVLPSKRRRSSLSSSGGSGHKARRHSKVLSVTNLLDIWNQLAENQQKYQLAQHALQRIDDHLAAHADESALENLVGDALQQAVRQNNADLQAMLNHRRELYALACERRALGQEAMRYLPWLESALQHDQDDIRSAESLRERIAQFQPLHAQLARMRQIIRQEEREKAARMAELERKRQEAEENERFRQAALAKETEAKPGMVWNPTTREYQSLNTDESWRD